VDLGYDMPISLAMVRNYVYNLGKYGPDTIKVYTATSEAPTVFTLQGEASSPIGLWFEIPFASVTARYVKFEISKHNHGSGTNTEWLFIDELVVY